MWLIRSEHHMSILSERKAINRIENNPSHTSWVHFTREKMHNAFIFTPILCLGRGGVRSGGKGAYCELVCCLPLSFDHWATHPFRDGASMLFFRGGGGRGTFQYSSKSLLRVSPPPRPNLAHVFRDFTTRLRARQPLPFKTVVSVDGEAEKSREGHVTRDTE